MKAKGVIVALILLAVLWHIEPSNTLHMILKKEFSEKTEKLIAHALNMVIIQAIELKTLTDFMVRKVKANIKMEEIGYYTTMPEAAKEKCSKLLKYQPDVFDDIINDTTEKASEFIRDIIKLRIQSRGCKFKVMVELLMCLLTVGNNLNSLYLDRFKLLGPLVFRLNQTLSLLSEDYRICLHYIETLPNSTDPFAVNQPFIKADVPHVDLPGCDHVHVFINRETGEISWTPCNQTALDNPHFLLKK